MKTLTFNWKRDKLSMPSIDKILCFEKTKCIYITNSNSLSDFEYNYYGHILSKWKWLFFKHCIKEKPEYPHLYSKEDDATQFSRNHMELHYCQRLQWKNARWSVLSDTMIKYIIENRKGPDPCSLIIHGRINKPYSNTVTFPLEDVLKKRRNIHICALYNNCSFLLVNQRMQTFVYFPIITY